jgi:hypothetical protein
MGAPRLTNLAQSGLRSAKVVLRVVDPRLARHRSIRQAPLALPLLAGPAVLALGAGLRGAGALQVRLVVRPVDAHQGLPHLEEAARDE